MKIQEYVVVPTLAVTMAGVLLLGATVVHAQSTGQKTLVQTIAQTFALDQSKVQSVVDAYRNDHQSVRLQNMTNREEQRLDQAVKDGKLTDAQKQAIESKLTELKNNYSSDSFKNLSQTDKKKTIQDDFARLKSWAKSQHISLSYLRIGMGMGRRNRYMHQTTPTPTPS